MKLLLDRMHTPAIAEALSWKGLDVIAVADTPLLRGCCDSDALDYAVNTDRAVVTEDVGDCSVLTTRRATTGQPHAGVIFTNPNRFNRASLAYPGDVITALESFLDTPPVTGESWVWWL